MKGHGFHLLKYVKGAENLSFCFVKSPTRLRDFFYGCSEKGRENVLVFDFDFSIFLKHCI